MNSFSAEELKAAQTAIKAFQIALALAEAKQEQGRKLSR